MSKRLTAALLAVLSDTFALYRLTHLYHWNVAGGPCFAALHKLFNDQYDDLFEAVDGIAEFIRGTGEMVAPVFADASAIYKRAGLRSAQDMLRDLVAGHDAAIVTIGAALDVATADDDQAVINLLADRLQKHRFHRWMLVSSLGDEAA